MSIRFNKALRELNIGLQTAVDFLEKKSELGEVKAEPSFKLNDAQYKALTDAFKQDAEVRNEAEKLFIKKPKEKKHAEEPKDHRAESLLKSPSVQKFNPLGKVDLDIFGKKSVATESAAKEVKAEEEKTAAVSPKPEDNPTKNVSMPKNEAPKPVEKPVEPKKVVVETKVEVKQEPKVEPKPETKIEPKVEPKVEQKAEPKVEQKIEQKIEPKAEPKPQVKVEVKQKPVNQPQAPKQKKEEVKVEKPSFEQQKPAVEKPVAAKAPENVDKSQSHETKQKPAEQNAKKKQKNNYGLLEKNEDGIFQLSSETRILNAPKVNVIGKIDLNSLNQSTRPKKKSKEDRRKEHDENAQAGGRKKRTRINKERVDINAAVQNQQHNGGGNNGNNNNNGQNKGQQQKRKNKNRGQNQGQNQNHTRKPLEVNEEDVARQVKETLARLTNKQNQNKKGARYRKEKRDAVQEKLTQEASAEKKESKTLKLTEFVTVSELASMMNVPVNKVISTLMSVGIMVSINQRLDAETINLVVDEFGFKTEYVSAEVQEAISEDLDEENDLVPRAPIVTVMGHVDHGKTSLLDYIRNTNVIAGEAGGITQHIGAYNVTLDNGRKITFLDTPGHEAFTAMRARGAQVTDIAIIIIAADDSVMPTTKEAIAHAQAAGVPMVFAINKIDKPGANPDKIREDLANMNLLVEEWGGKYQCQEISAKKGTGVKELLDKVLLEAEMLDLKANPNRKATGSIIESSLDKGRGYVSTLLVSNGTLNIGDVVIAGTSFGRIKAMFNERNQKIDSAKPAEPAIILGLDGAPQAGDQFHVLDSEQEARDIANKRLQLQREQSLRTQKRLTLGDISHRIARGEFHELNIIVKGDTDGSIEALSDSFIKLSTEKIKVNVIFKAVGQISESDVTLADASDAIIVGFQVRPSANARRLAESEGVEINTYSVIYDAIDDVKQAMEGMLDKVKKEIITGQAEVRQVYKISKVGTVAGAFVTEGKIHRADKIRVVRDGIVIKTASINALKRFKDDVKEVGVNFDCGISLADFNDIQAGDVLESFTEIEVQQKL
jgi:translation initiation factor IF-2